MINIKNFDSKLLKIDKKKSHKNFGIFSIGYITRKNSDYVKINSVNPCIWLLMKQMDPLKNMEINT